MRILMLAPEPFFEPRGTPFSVYHRAQALGRLGHEIDLVTYPLGNTVELPHVTIFRSWRIPGIRRVKIGPSLAKIPLDIALFFRALGMLFARRYDCIHTHEEAGVFGALLGWVFRTPHIYDMHSDLAQQMTNFKFTQNKTLIGLMHTIERLIVHSAKAVIVICPELLVTVAEIAPCKLVMLIENTAVAAEEVEISAQSDALAVASAALRRRLNIDATAGPILLYTGTFESYQGLELVVESMQDVLSAFPNALYIIAGGHPDQVAALQQHAERLGVAHALRLPGQRPPTEMPIFMALADVLLSPRCHGTNTPLKIYSYLHARKPILATKIRSHTQVLTDEVALLIEPTSSGLALGAKALLGDAELCQRLAQNAQALAQQEYSYATFLMRTATVYQYLGQ